MVTSAGSSVSTQIVASVSPTWRRSGRRTSRGTSPAYPVGQPRSRCGSAAYPDFRHLRVAGLIRVVRSRADANTELVDDDPSRGPEAVFVAPASVLCAARRCEGTPAVPVEGLKVKDLASCRVRLA